MLNRQGSDPIAARAFHGTVVIGKGGREWKNLTAVEVVFGYDDACAQCRFSKASKAVFMMFAFPINVLLQLRMGGAECLPTIWQSRAAAIGQCQLGS